MGVPWKCILPNPADFARVSSGRSRQVHGRELRRRPLHVRRGDDHRLAQEAEVPVDALFGNAYFWHELVHMYLAGYMVTGFLVASAYAAARLRLPGREPRSVAAAGKRRRRGASIECW